MNVIRQFRICKRSIRYLSSGTQVPSHGYCGPPLIFQVCGAGTGVGKTVLAAALVRTAALGGRDAAYIKPVQSGYPESNDTAVVLSHSPRPSQDSTSKTGRVVGTTLIKLSHPTSPDLAAELEGSTFTSHDDANLCIGIEREFSLFNTVAKPGWLGLVEGAGGVLSPAPSGSLLADVLRPLRMPTVLVGDSRLGGISNTLCAYDAMRLRGYDVPVIVLFENPSPHLENVSSVSRCLSSTGTSVFSAPELPRDDELLENYLESEGANSFFQNMLSHLETWQTMRFDELRNMSEAAERTLWYPFTQHSSLQLHYENKNKEEPVTAIDSAHGMQFMVYDRQQGVKNMVDAVGSWWTNGAGHGNARVARAIGAAAGRYGHVLFPEAVHEPAWKLATNLLAGPGKGWANRVFYTDNGSTAVEVSLKMAFRKRASDVPSRAHLPVRIVSLDGCYHGDTLGAMDCAPPSDFNSRQTPWYQARSVSFNPPTVAIVGGVWTCVPPQKSGGLTCDLGDRSTFPDRSAAFCLSRDGRQYDEGLMFLLRTELDKGQFDLGALLIEPVLLGSGGMRLVDPAFQRALIRVCRSLSIPIVFDEIFTGIWRLGTQCGAELLGLSPDIASYGKLLTGGTVPLSATLATENIFNVFLGDSKKDALLHGHSYTAHAIGCSAAVESLALYHGAKLFNPDLNCFEEFWDDGIAREISCLPGVKRATVIGTVLAVEMGTEGSAGYSSTSCEQLTRTLRGKGLFCRPLGSVIYVMCSLLASREECSSISATLFEVLEAQAVDSESLVSKLDAK